MESNSLPDQETADFEEMRRLEEEEEDGRCGGSGKGGEGGGGGSEIMRSEFVMSQ